MNTQQIQLKISLSDQLNDLLLSRAMRLGIPVTQLVKHLIIKEVETEEYPVFKASKETEKAAQKALDELSGLKPVSDIHEYFKQL